MEFGFSKEEHEIIEEVRDFIEQNATPELLRETQHNEGIFGGDESRKFFKEFAKKGWLSANWPKELGGLGTTDVVAYMIRDEMSYLGLPSYFNGIHMAGPTILRFGSEEMKKKYLPPIAKAEIEFALGYTEPTAGSDLLGIKMFAEDKGDHFVVNGQKIFNTTCHMAEYHWLAVRTDLKAPRHKGMSMMIVDMDSEGITLSPLITMSGARTNLVYYDNVIVPKENLVGEVNKGFYYLMTALDYERIFTFGEYRRLFDDIVEYAKKTEVNGIPLSKRPLVRQKLAQCRTELSIARLLYYQLPFMLDKGVIPNYQSSMEKLFVTEMDQRITHVGMELIGLYGHLAEEDPLVQINGKMAYFHRQCPIETIYAGTSEIQRNIMAIRGLGLPRSK